MEAPVDRTSPSDPPCVTGQPIEGVNLDLSHVEELFTTPDAGGMISIQMTEFPSCDITIQKSGFTPLRQNALDLPDRR